jgi:hypothetical protein
LRAFGADAFLGEARTAREASRDSRPAPRMKPHWPDEATKGRDVAFRMAAVAIPRNLFPEILRPIAELRPPLLPSTA